MIPFKLPVRRTFDGYGIEDADGKVIVPTFLYGTGVAHIQKQREKCEYVCQVLNSAAPSNGTVSQGKKKNER